MPPNSLGGIHLFQRCLRRGKRGSRRAFMGACPVCYFTLIVTVTVLALDALYLLVAAAFTFTLTL